MNTKREEFSSKEAKLLVIEWKIQVTKRQQLQPILAFCFSTFLVCTCFNIFSQLEQDKLKLPIQDSNELTEQLPCLLCELQSERSERKRKWNTYCIRGTGKAVHRCALEYVRCNCQIGWMPCSSRGSNKAFRPCEFDGGPMR